MKKAKYAHVIGTKCQNDIMSVSFSDPIGDTEYYYDPPTNETISSDPLVPGKLYLFHFAP